MENALTGQRKPPSPPPPKTLLASRNFRDPRRDSLLFRNVICFYVNSIIIPNCRHSRFRLFQPLASGDREIVCNELFDATAKGKGKFARVQIK